MDFGTWSPSHTILALFIVAGFIGQVAVLFYRVGQTEKRLTRSEERAEKRDAELLAMIDKLIGEVNQRIDSLRSEMNQRFSDMQGEINDVRNEIRQMNQNHIDHLNRHHSA